MRSVRLPSFFLFFAPLAFAAPLIARAHEVYVLTPPEIAQGTTLPPFSSWDVMMGDFHRFVFWGFIAALVIFLILGISVMRPIERRLNHLFERGKKYAPMVSRVTVGLAFLAAAYYNASYGPELPLASTFGAYTPLIRGLLVLIGVLIIAGLYTRTAALVAVALYGAALYYHGSYMLTYTNYLGEILVLLLIGAHHGSFEGALDPRAYRGLFGRLAQRAAPYSFVILRVCFGISLLYAALYAKFFHNYLALQVAQLPLAGHSFGLDHYFGFEPHFLVLGAGLVEIVIACFFILGIEIRFTSLFLEFWLSLSLWYFGEVVWPHLILIGIPIAFILYGYDKYSLEGYFFKKVGREPAL